jgi:hypothetical protein
MADQRSSSPRYVALKLYESLRTCHVFENQIRADLARLSEPLQPDSNVVQIQIGQVAVITALSAANANKDPRDESNAYCNSNVSHFIQHLRTTRSARVVKKVPWTTRFARVPARG